VEVSERDQRYEHDTRINVIKCTKNLSGFLSGMIHTQARQLVECCNTEMMQ